MLFSHHRLCQCPILFPDSLVFVLLTHIIQLDVIYTDSSEETARRHAADHIDILTRH